MHTCNKGHVLTVINGHCADCNRERQTRHREVNRIARELCAALQESGVPLDAGRIAEGHRLLSALDLARHPSIAFC